MLNGLRRRSSSHRPPVAPRFKSAFAAAPAAVSVALVLDVAVAVACVALAPKILTSGVLLLALASLITLAVSLAARSQPAFLASVLTLAAECVIADLPIHRSGAVVFAAAAGAAVLVFAEAGGTALEPKGGGTHVGRPSSRHVLWVALVAAGGAVAGWLLLALQPDMSGLGLAAVGVGVLAAICLIALTTVLATAVLTDRRRD
jgi:hypothetical protein